MHRTCLNTICNRDRCDKVALRTTCTKNVKLKIIKIRTGCQHVLPPQQKPNLDCTKPSTRSHVAHGLDIAVITLQIFGFHRCISIGQNGQ